MRRQWFFEVSGILLACILTGCADAKRETSYSETDETVISIESDVVNLEEINPTLQSEHIIHINEIDNDAEIMFAGSMFDLGEENFREMTKEEVLGYFGVELAIETILPDMVKNGEERYGFYQFADGSVLDQQAFSFQSVEETLHIVIRGEQLPIHSLGNNSEFDISQIYGYEALLIHFADALEKDIYYAEFITNKAGMTIHYSGKSEEDFIKIVEYFLCQ